MEIKQVHKATCHCGSVELELRMPNGLVDARRCSCSMCRKRGTVMASVEVENLMVTRGEEFLTLYQFNTLAAKHYFCKRCGIYTHHQRRSNPYQFGINVACLEGINPYDLPNITVTSGVHEPGEGIGL
ncbi:GFA family protein [Enterovibrio coralii]|uniref:Aldehyde-activating protein n=1 Tax=Enterovibrio coralii TaxID=294935 RepID=A0A135I920_9GAMM|nr:GFA family protein [Enterovibrio coralii]KXF81945.1 aldehyde-activating protein [Enterovibrio coralii]